MFANHHVGRVNLNLYQRHVLGVDPGSKLTAYVLIAGQQILAKGKVKNETLMAEWRKLPKMPEITMIEKIGMGGKNITIDRAVFETAWWTGRLYEQALRISGRVEMVHRKAVVAHHTHSAKGGDKEVRHALLRRYGGEAYAIGKKANPGPLYGVAGDMWSALAIALYAQRVII